MDELHINIKIFSSNACDIYLTILIAIQKKY